MHVDIHESRPIDAEGAHVVAAFPSVGLVATIVANHLIERLGLEEVGVVDGPDFPTLSVVQNGRPMHPVRIYAGTYKTPRGDPQKVIVFLSEFQPRPELVRPVATTILEWCRSRGATWILSPEGLAMDGQSAGVYGIGSTDASRQVLEDMGLPLFQEGIVAGVTGVLLNLASRTGFDVVGILSEAVEDHPDARSAATVIEVLGALVEAELDVDTLLGEADAFENEMAAQAKKAKANEDALDRLERPEMYG